MLLKKLMAVAAVSMFLACGKIPNINPPAPPTPQPTPPPEEEVAPTPVCVPPGLVTGCWHHPPGQDWQFIPAPVVNCALTEAGLEVSQTQGPSELQPVVISAIAALGDHKGEAPATVRQLLADQLTLMGQCAIAGQEAVFVQRSDKLVEEFHAVYEGDGGWTYNGKFVGLHRVKGTSTPTPTPPPVSSGCPAQPCPARLNADGNPAWKWNVHPHTMGNKDSTPVVVKQLSFCEAIGMSPDANGVPRAECPVRPDGHPDRVAVEAWLLEGGPVRVGRAGQNCTPNNTDNPMAFLAGTGNCRICNTPLTVCSDWQ